MKKSSSFAAALLILGLAIAGFALLAAVMDGNDKKKEANLKSFNSYDELAEFLKAGQQVQGGGLYEVFAAGAPMKATAEAASDTASRSSDYSTTNIQVEGVDEADIVKSDGKHIYAISGSKLIIVDAYPAENARIVSETAITGQPLEMFVNGDKLAVFSHEYGYYAAETGNAKPTIMPRRRPDFNRDVTHISIYDIAQREKPELARTITIRGNYRDSRMIGNYVYAIANQPVYYSEGPVPLPAITASGIEKEVAAQDIYYFDHPYYGHSYTNIIAVNIQDDNEAHASKTYLGEGTQNIYVSEGNIYLTGTAYGQDVPVLKAAATAANPVLGKVVSPSPIAPPVETTTIQKIAIDKDRIEYKGEGSVPGHILNQFSMDEHEGYFRIATTIGQAWNRQQPSQNNIYVLDGNLRTVGKVEDLAPGESIYSARFLGDRAYLVTFKKVDPLFVVDLSVPEEPKVLGKLKIPGYSDYLHPYDENHIIGIGKEAVEAEEGDFAWYQGVKLALFDVSDPENPREVSKFNIGDRGTDSEALHDHKAFLFSKDKKLLVIPVLLAEIDENDYANGKVPPHAYGEFTWQGAYVLNLDLDNGFSLNGKVTHLDNEEGKQQLLMSGYYFGSGHSIKRSLYIDDVLYTISDSKVKMNDLGSMEEVGSISLPEN
ncbi:beta-propeller domain-containing protein [Candidatus Woesearchaeota archaeon]|nr:beta-propeller domain-containing protein [Candidatus Woesearchaeota archaeon]